MMQEMKAAAGARIGKNSTNPILPRQGKINDRGVAAVAYNVLFRPGVTVGIGASFDTQKLDQATHKVRIRSAYFLLPPICTNWGTGRRQLHLRVLSFQSLPTRPFSAHSSKFRHDAGRGDGSWENMLVVPITGTRIRSGYSSHKTRTWKTPTVGGVD